MSIDKKQVAKEIARLRLSKGLSQAQLAKEMKVDRDTIYRWENGTYLPRSDKRLELAKLFNVDFQSIFADPDARADAAHAMSVDEVMRVLNNEKATESEKRTAMTLATRSKRASPKGTDSRTADFRRMMDDAHDSIIAKLAQLRSGQG